MALSKQGTPKRRHAAAPDSDTAMFLTELPTHELPDQASIMGSITGFSATAMSPHDIPNLVARAFAAFRNQRPRPVHIALPLDVMTKDADWQGGALPTPAATAA